MTDLDLAAIQARADAATEGPWEAEIGESIEVNAGTAKTVWDETGRFGKPARSWRFTDRILEVECEDSDLPDDDYAIVAANATFIAHARTDIPALIAEVKALRTQHESAPHGSWCNSWFGDHCDCWKAGHSQVMLTGGPRYPSKPTTGEPDE